MNQVKVRFEWFHPNTSPMIFFPQIFKSIGADLVIVTKPNDYCDLEIIGVHKPRKTKVLNRMTNLISNGSIGDIDSTLLYPKLYNPRTSEARNRIWFTMENIRPPVQGDLLTSLSFDQFDFGGTNLYLPCWYLEVGIFEPIKLDYVGIECDIADLLKPRRLEGLKSKKFACSIFRNPHQVRLRGIEALSKIGKIDLYGPISDGKFLKDKFSVAQNYKYTVCFENDLYPGYVTEKLLEAYVTGTVPIYWGDLGNDQSINRDSFINMKDFRTLDEFVDFIDNIDDVKYQEIFQQPFLNSVPDISSIQRLLAKVV